MNIPQTVTCPRCGRVGRVSPDPRRPNWLQVNWPPRARSPEHPKRGRDKDTGLSIDGLRDPSFGCGYDGPGEVA